MLSGGPACIKSGGGRLGLWVYRISHWSRGALLGGAAGAQEWHLRRVPEPLELVLPVVLLADARVDQGSIGTPVVSISSCFSLFNNAVVLDGGHRWVPGLRSFLELPTQAFIRSPPRA